MAELGADLNDAPIFQGLSDEEFDYVRRQVTSQPFKAGDSLLIAGREAPGILVISSGLVSAIVADDSGHERQVATLGKGECVGEIALMTAEPCSATVRAITDGEALLLRREAFLELVEHYPGLWRNVGRILSQRLVRTSRHLSQPALTNTVFILTDCAEDQSAVLSVLIAHSLARQTVKRVLVVDLRIDSSFPVSHVAGAAPAPTAANIFRDRSRLKELEARTGANGTRVMCLRGQGDDALGEDECMAALESVTPLFDYVILLDRKDHALLRPLVVDRVRSILALATDISSDAVPPWLDALINAPNARQKLEVALLTGDRRAPYVLEEIESRLDKTVVRLPITGITLARMTEDAWPADTSAPVRKIIDRLARQIGQIEIGVALGAGAAKGFAHIGVLKVLEEHQIPVDYVAGCSIGAIVGAMYAGGLSFEEIEERMQGADRKVRRWHLPLRSVWSDAGLKELLRAPYPTTRFRDLPTPFAVVATDIATGREIVIRKGLVWRAVQASASVPGIFPPALVSRRHLIDGGLVNPVPSQTVRDLGADIVIAVDLMSPSARAHHTSKPSMNSGVKARVPNLVEMLWRATEIMQEEVTLRSAATADITIEPKLGRVRWSDFSHRGREFITLGEQAASEKLPELERLLTGLGAGA